MGELSSLIPDKTLDVTGRVCPYPLVFTKKSVEKMESGQVLKVLCDAPASAEDSIPKWSEKYGHTFESVRQGDEEKWELFIKKA